MTKIPWFNKTESLIDDKLKTYEVYCTIINNSQLFEKLNSLQHPLIYLSKNTTLGQQISEEY